MPFYTDPVDTLICQMTQEGRNLLARIKFGSDLLYRAIGWQVGRGGYNYTNPVKVTPLVDSPTQSVGYIEVVNNTSWDAGDKIVINGVEFTRGLTWVEGATIQQTVLNILAAVNDSTDPRVFRLVLTDVDPFNNHRLRFTSLVTGNVLGDRLFTFLPAAVNTGTDTITLAAHGFQNYMQVQLDSTITVPGGTSALTNYYIANATTNTFQLSSTLNTPTVVDLTTQGTGTLSVIPTGNIYPINNNETTGLGSTVNFLVTPMSLATSTTLLDPAYPVPPTLGTFALPDGKIETPTPSAVSFLMRIPDGPVGMNAYGEVGVWVEVIESLHPMEVGRKVLFAHGHFPILAKPDRLLATFRVIINFG